MKEKITTTTYKYDEKGNLIEKVEQVIERGNEINLPPIGPKPYEKNISPTIPPTINPISPGIWEPYIKEPYRIYCTNANSSIANE